MDHSIGIERSCKTEQLELDVAIEPEEIEAEPRSLESSDAGEFYTLEEIMKGKPAERGLFSDLPSSFSSQTPRRFPSRNFSASDQPLAVSKPLSGEASETHLRIQHGFPQQPVEFASAQDLLRSARPWMLRRLLQLWREGHAELLRALFKHYPDWQLQIGEAGLVEVSHDASER